MIWNQKHINDHKFKVLKTKYVTIFKNKDKNVYDIIMAVHGIFVSNEFLTCSGIHTRHNCEDKMALHCRLRIIKTRLDTPMSYRTNTKGVLAVGG